MKNIEILKNIKFNKKDSYYNKNTNFINCMINIINCNYSKGNVVYESDCKNDPYSETCYYDFITIETKDNKIINKIPVPVLLESIFSNMEFDWNDSYINEDIEEQLNSIKNFCNVIKDIDYYKIETEKTLTEELKEINFYIINNNLNYIEIDGEKTFTYKDGLFFICNGVNYSNKIILPYEFTDELLRKIYLGIIKQKIKAYNFNLEDYKYKTNIELKNSIF